MGFGMGFEGSLLFLVAKIQKLKRYCHCHCLQGTFFSNPLRKDYCTPVDEESFGKA